MTPIIEIKFRAENNDDYQYWNFSFNKISVDNFPIKFDAEPGDISMGIWKA